MRNRHLSICFIFLFTSSNLANSATVIDQSFFVEGGGSLSSLINECCQYIGQTFTGGKTGKLESVRIDVQFSSELETPGVLRASLWSTQNSLPLNSLSEVILPSKTSLISQKIVFPTEISIKKGTLYALLVDYSNAPPPGPHQAMGYWNGEVGNQYKEGEMIAYYNDEGRWINQGDGYDVFFETYVSQVPIPGAIWLFCFGIIGLFNLAAKTNKRKSPM